MQFELSAADVEAGKDKEVFDKYVNSDEFARFKQEYPLISEKVMDEILGDRVIYNDTIDTLLVAHLECFAKTKIIEKNGKLTIRKFSYQTGSFSILEGIENQSETVKWAIAEHIKRVASDFARFYCKDENEMLEMAVRFGREKAEEQIGAHGKLIDFELLDYKIVFAEQKLSLSYSNIYVRICNREEQYFSFVIGELYPYNKKYIWDIDLPKWEEKQKNKLKFI